MSSSAGHFPHAAVCSPHYLATAAGVKVLHEGGNALDAAIATNLTLAVVTPYLCGFGGDLFAIIFDGRQAHGYIGSGRSPTGASLERVGSDVPSRGPMAVTVPGAVRGWFDLLEKLGTKSFEQLAATALGYARDGFVLSAGAAATMAASGSQFRGDWAHGWHEVFDSAAAGEMFAQPQLAQTITAIARRGPQAFYSGAIAKAISESTQGWISTADLAAHLGEWVAPMRHNFAGLEILEMPPPTQGVSALEAIAIFESLPATKPNTAIRNHALIEAVKVALCDRDVHLTDPQHMQIDPQELLNGERTSRAAAGIRPSLASTPPAGRAAQGGTAYLCATDKDGMCVSLIQSNYMGFGSGVSTRGINLQNRGAYFSSDENHVNALGPSKRTLHTLVPAMALRDGKPALVFGTMGGDGQIQTHAQLLARYALDGELPAEFISAPRWVINPSDWKVAAEVSLGQTVIDGLRKRGHHIKVVSANNSAMGHAHAIARGPKGWYAASDPRCEGAALGY